MLAHYTKSCLDDLFFSFFYAILFLGFGCVITCRCGSFIFLATWYSVERTFTRSFSCRQLVSFPFSLFCCYNYKMNILVYASLFPHGGVSPGYRHKSRIMCFQAYLKVDSEGPTVVQRRSPCSTSLLKSAIITL